MAVPEKKERSAFSLILIFFILSAGIVTTGYVYYRNYEKSFRTEVENQLSAIADLKVNELVNWRIERLGDAAVFYRNANFSERVRQYLKTPGDPEAKIKLRTWISQFHTAYRYDKIFLLDARGVERLSVPDKHEPVAPHLLKRYSETLHSGQITFLDFHRDAPDRPIHLSIIVPIIEGQEASRPIGLLVLRIDPHKYLYSLIKRWPTPSKTAETLLIRREGNEVVFLNELKFQKNAALNLRIPIEKTEILAVKTVLGQQGVVEGKDYRGVSAIGDVRAVPDSPWFMVTRMDTSEVYGPLREKLWIMVFLIGALLIGAGAGVGLLWRHQSVHYYRERYNASEKLFAITSRQESILFAVPDIIMEVNANKVYTWANQAGKEFFGEDVIGREAAFYFEGEQEIYKTVKPVFNGNENVIYVESWQRRKDGQKRLLAWWCRVLKDKSGSVTGALSTARDITDINRAESALRDSEVRYRRLFEAAQDGILIIDAETGMIIDANPYLIDLLGFPLEAFIGKALWELGFFKDIVANKENFLELQQKEYIRYEDLPLETSEGRKINVEFVSNVYLVDHHKIIQCNIRDITERKRVEAALRRYTERLQNMHKIDQAILQVIESPEAIAQTAIQNIRGLLQCQRASIGIFDLEKKEVRVFAADVEGKTIVQIGKILTEEVYGDIDILRQSRMEIIENMSRVTSPSAVNRILQIEGVQSSINVALVSARGFYGVLNIGWKDPRTITLEETEIVGEAAGQITIAIEQALLLKETKRYAAELEQRVIERTAQLESANKELEAFAYSVSHDLRAPLRAIDGFSRFVLEDYAEKLDAEGKRLLNVIRTNTQKMDHLITDILELSRASRTEMKLSRIDMTTLVNSVYHEVASPEIQEKFVFSVSALTDAFGDPTLIRQVWTNLISNAIKYTMPKEDRRIEIVSRMENSMSVYSIKDTGVGFNPDYAHKLFGLFQRLHKAEEFEGAGVGLAIVQRIILRHGGKVWAEGKVNEGATFCFSIPIKQ